MPSTANCRSEPASCARRIMLSAWSARQSRTEIVPVPTITSTSHWTSRRPAYGFAAGASELDDEIGEEDIGHLHWLDDGRRARGDRLLQRRLAGRCDDLAGLLLAEQLEDTGPDPHQLDLALLDVFGVLGAGHDQPYADAEVSRAARIGEVRDERLEADDAAAFGGVRLLRFSGRLRGT